MMLKNNFTQIDTSFETKCDGRTNGGWLNTREAARYLSITPNALRILVCRGKVKAYKLGQRLRFELKDLKILLRAS